MTPTCDHGFLSRTRPLRVKTYQYYTGSPLSFCLRSSEQQQEIRKRVIINIHGAHPPCLPLKRNLASASTRVFCCMTGIRSDRCTPHISLVYTLVRIRSPFSFFQYGGVPTRTYLSQKKATAARSKLSFVETHFRKLCVIYTV